MKKKKTLLNIVILLAILSGIAYAANGVTSSVRFITDMSTYVQGDTVTFSVINDGNDTVNLSSSAPWWVENTNGDTVFSPIAAQVITPLEPGQSINWTWDQKDNDGNQVPTGTYKGVISTDTEDVSTQEFEIETSTTNDTIAPTTTINVEEGKQYQDNVTIILSATDDESGVNRTEYILENPSPEITGNTLLYTEPIFVSSEGDHNITYWSTDNADNQEEHKTVNFTIVNAIVIIPPTITDFVIDPSTSISENRPAIASANVKDDDLQYFEFSMVDANDLLRPDRMVFGVDINLSKVNGIYRSHPWYGKASQVKTLQNAEYAEYAEYATAYYIDSAACTWCNEDVMVKVDFKKNDSVNNSEAYMWFNIGNGNMTRITVGFTPIDIESGNSTVSIVNAVFANGIDKSPISQKSDKVYTLYTIGDSTNPVMVETTVPIGMYKINAYAADLSGMNESLWNDVDTIPYTFESDRKDAFVKPGENAQYVLTINNTDNVTNIYNLGANLTANVDPKNATVSLTKDNIAIDNITVDAGASQNVTLTVNSSDSGTYVVDVTASPQEYSQRYRTITTKTYVDIARITNFEAGNGYAGGQIKADVTVENRDNQSHLFAVVVNETNQGPLIGTGVVKLDVGQSIKVPILIATPSTSAGTHELYAGVYLYDDEILDLQGLIDRSGPAISNISSI